MKLQNLVTKFPKFDHKIPKLGHEIPKFGHEIFKNLVTKFQNLVTKFLNLVTKFQNLVTKLVMKMLTFLKILCNFVPCRLLSPATCTVLAIFTTLSIYTSCLYLFNLRDVITMLYVCLRDIITCESNQETNVTLNYLWLL